MTAGAQFTQWLQRAFPERCPACLGPAENGLCSGCAAELRRIERPCPFCALPAPVPHCPRDMRTWHVARVLAPFVYTYPLDFHLQALKFAGNRTLGRALALRLARAAADAGPPAAELLVPVPLHPARLVERGYNQAVEVARPLAAELGLRMDSGAAVRSRGAVAQSRLHARARHANVVGAFRVRRRLDGCHVAVVDDVITTGATVNALAEALLEAGAARVDALAVARTVAP